MMKNMIRPAPAADFALTHNPLSSGTTMLQLLVKHHEAGLSLANDQLAIFVVTRLYNALRQLHMIETKWDIMERVIRLHKKALFADAIPTKTKDIADSYVYRLNVYGRQKNFAKDEKYELRETGSMQILRLLLEENPTDQSRALDLIEKEVDAKTSKKPPEGQKKSPADHSYLGSIQQAVDEILADASIDYIRLTKRCVRFVKDFRRMWDIANQALEFDSNPAATVQTSKTSSTSSFAERLSTKPRQPANQANTPTKRATATTELPKARSPKQRTRIDMAWVYSSQAKS
jgi:hypothetical protein